MVESREGVGDGCLVAMFGRARRALRFSPPFCGFHHCLPKGQMQDEHAGHNNDSIPQAALTLSDIIHTMSPSPAPQPAPDPFSQFPHEHHSPILINNDEPEIGPSHTSESPGPPDPEELATIHTRVQELGILDADLSDSSITAREKWLAETVCSS